MSFKKVQVSDDGVELGYIDSGPVNDSSDYTTIIVIHGLCFSSTIFKRVQAMAASKNIRFIAVSRRNYPGSTAFTPAELEVMVNGTDEQRDTWMKNRGHEYAILIDKLIEKYQLPPVASDRKSGGVVLYGWSLGSGEANATIAHADTLPASVRDRLQKYLRALILHEGPPLVFGLPMPEKNWAPFQIESVPPELKFPMFAQWVTGYFDHGNALATRELNDLSYILPSSFKPGTIYNLTMEEYTSAVCTGQKEASSEIPYMFGFQSQLHSAYQKALFDPQIKTLFPSLVKAYLSGEKAPAFGIAAMWAIQDEAEKRGALKSMRFEMVEGINHFPHWEEPERALDIYLKLASPL
ncbi:hypothetical protein JR316_0009250 [Psilocybe cubensis]|uniref:AB hydrolase-1 domain-containing protein n=2 Tax=Psilocybe cubensis TaxID=181762 RepID=A0A8H7XV02_PSICU|nr:hypothetical protein JR316_0009250 [Psilocybe cubensis]KAH9478789.1 hypothetical protein JR316_0009250 [Psilocybe cubensis]